MKSDPCEIAIAVVEHKGNYLIGRRPPGVPLAGQWEFPGGKVNLGEEPEAAAVRECLEETGLVVEALERLLLVEHEYSYGRLALDFYSCRLSRPSDDSLPSPLAPFIWAPRETLPTYEFPAANAKLIELLMACAITRGETPK